MFDVVELEEQAGKAAGTDASMLAAHELLAAAVGLERVRSLLELAEARVLAELEARVTCEDEFGLSTRTWLANTAGVSPRSTTARVATAKGLRHWERVADAVADGRLSFDHAAALASISNPRVRDALADRQDAVIDLAKDRSFRSWQTHVRRLVDLLDQDGPEPDDPTRNRLRFGETLDGVTHLAGTMTADVALAIRTAVEAKADDLFRAYTRDRNLDPTVDVPSRATLRMLALAALLSEGSTGRAEVTLFLHDQEVTERDGNPVPKAAAGVWGCDPDLWAVLVDHMGVPLDLGHGPRFASSAMRRALAIRDGGCTFPGCDRPRSTATPTTPPRRLLRSEEVGLTFPLVWGSTRGRSVPGPLVLGRVTCSLVPATVSAVGAPNNSPERSEGAKRPTRVRARAERKRSARLSTFMVRWRDDRGATTVKFAIALGTLSPRAWIDVAEAADELGFESVWIPEHLVLPADMAGSPYVDSDHPPIPSTVPVFDALAYHCFLAARTSRLRLGTHVFNIGLRHPFVTARAVTTLDVLSNGRVEFGIGASWLEAEWRAVGLDFAARGARVDECIDVCRRLWCEPVVEHHGSHFDFEPVMFEPKPVQQPGPPIHIGGDSPAALRRVASRGDGWIPMNHTVEQIPASLARIAAWRQESGRTTAIEVTMGATITSPDDIEPYAAAGVHRVFVKPWASSRDALGAMERFAADVMVDR